MVMSRNARKVLSALLLFTEDDNNTALKEIEDTTLKNMNQKLIKETKLEQYKITAALHELAKYGYIDAWHNLNSSVIHYATINDVGKVALDHYNRDKAIVIIGFSIPILMLVSNVVIMILQ